MRRTSATNRTVIRTRSLLCTDAHFSPCLMGVSQKCQRKNAVIIYSHFRLVLFIVVPIFFLDRLNYIACFNDSCALSLAVFISNSGSWNNCYLLYSWRFSRYSAPIHWLVHGHMTSNNETVSRQMP